MVIVLVPKEDAQGAVLLVSSQVYVDRKMKVGDMLMLGDMESEVAADPIQEPLAFTIQRFEALPNLKNTETLYTAFL